MTHAALIDDLITPDYVNALAGAARRIAAHVERLELTGRALALATARRLRTQHTRLARLNRRAFEHVEQGFKR